MIKKFVGMGLEPIRCNGNKDSLREERSRTDGPLVHPLTNEEKMDNPNSSYN